ncbi:septum formation protein Maf [Allomyces macrogynus ATCC 38327]|uniref:Septum formation protein Maf n=1 Tax=Allomyces macrogynus (strain ATCC 38327) TaxID=578462 RepID=A0A0L0T8J2_ALLM3|nr:septum formation protein Maf [Allomyces macrogynus ATCC 38327]|eukprot:KNE71011.1 septum formation protein Maf [Allomyces macrogynus ATCC 38327]
MFDTIPELRGKRIVLASKSPRRVELLQQQGLVFDVIGSTFAEDLEHHHFDAPEHYVVTNAREKALQVYRSLTTPADLVIGADTVVVAPEGTMLEKPSSRVDAVATLRRLRDAESHRVVTGICLVLQQPAGEPRVVTFTESTGVKFGKVSDEDISNYVNTGDPMDKAGSYGYQSLAACLIAGIDGCFYNVVGLPLHRLYRELKAAVREQTSSVA